MIALLPCPHCGSEPWFEGDAGQWQDDNRYVEMSVKCCATLTEWIGWQKARDMTKAQREAELKTRLTAAWNKREVPEDAPKAAPARAEPTDEQIDAAILAEANRLGVVAEMCDFVDYDPEIGRVQEHWVPSLYSRAAARAVLALRGAA